MRFLRSCGAPARHDIYAGIHKGLRAFMADTLLRVGRLDADDSQAVTEALAAIDALLDLCLSHLAHEDAVIHPAMEACQAGASRPAAEHHEDHVHAIGRLRLLCDTLRHAPRPDRAEVAQRLYRLLGCFVGENLLHMHLEEIDHNDCLWRHYGDAELQALEGRIVASLSPAEMAVGLRWMVPAMAPAERLALLAPLSAKLPAHVFDGLMTVVRPHLSASDLVRLEEGLRQAA
ncbi:hypothetical protein G3580_01895 [Nitrogeniibacter mangrovi]|uniref:Hemerythrin-like domain-containing protein n=1 Tax=Nitrogeniibacter mangrovi TaxID=2016596 RepID=A0A6C1B2Q3_9RHOO|nr:hemerythrin domain-containing protein [Nitrogeniibacter mangrovi]QID16484.1 hypothetical protein G3580_01895 [Nitrogeniibacter mangrovi]